MGVIESIGSWLADLSAMFFPRLCEVCGRSLRRGEQTMCLDCDYNMPRCNITDFTDNFIHQRLMRDVVIDRATALFYYHRGSNYTNLILSAKYRGRPRIIYHLAADFARRLQSEGFFDGIDTVIPMPMHRTKKIRRGYNQTEYIARAIAEVAGLQITDNIVARRPHSTQTRKSSAQRWDNLEGIFAVDHPNQLAGRHILIVDDIITTGSTLHHCCKTLQTAVPTARISVLTLGATSLT